jgi:UDP-arabinose 4-epimerase
MTRILVTGGAGYIGSHTCKALRESGYEPVTVDSFVSGRRDFVKWGPCVAGDIRDTDLLVRVTRDYQINAVMHFASLIAVDESTREPASYYDVNVGGTASLLAAMRRAEVQRIVFSSSAAVYGAPEHGALNEACPLRPVNPYGRTKLAVEWMLCDYAQAYGMQYPALRYFNACGTAADSGIGEWHVPETHLIPLALAATQVGMPVLRVFGSDYDTPDGTCVPDYVHVSDLASAHVHALRAISATGKPEVSVTWNIGIGCGHSVSEVIASVEAVTGLPVRREVHGRRSGDPPWLVADAARIAQDSSWQPYHSSIANIVATAWAWHRRNGFAG